MISIVIPLYNKAREITHTLDSVLAQTYTDYEVIIVNDGSTDNSLHVVEQWINSSFLSPKTRLLHHSINSSFRLISQPNGGVCNARNRGVQESCGEFIAFLDADDLWDKEYLEEANKLIKDYPMAAMWGINYAETINGKIARFVPIGLPTDFKGYVDDYFHMSNRSSDLFTSSSTIVRKNQFLSIGGFDERLKYAEDLDLWWRMIAEFPCAFSAKVLAFYQQDTENRVDRGLTTPTFKYYFPYVVNKYKKYKSINPTFYHFIEQTCAFQIARYYFTVSDDYKDAKSVIKDLDFSAITFKYRLMLKSPYFVGKTIYNLIKFVKTRR